MIKTLQLCSLMLRGRRTEDGDAAWEWIKLNFWTHLKSDLMKAQDEKSEASTSSSNVRE